MMNIHYLWYLLPLIGIMAFLYASVGHGGASGYLAVLALLSFSPDIMKSSALLLNVFVSIIAFGQYARQGHFKWQLFWPFAIASIPFSFLGANYPLDDHLYKKILALCLFISICRLLLHNSQNSVETTKIKITYALLIGAAIGFISGMIGIGGGILLSPIILLLHWADLKKTAAVSALFIFVNSLAGLTALFSKGMEINTEVLYWLVSAIIGGTFGSYFGAGRFDSKVLKFILAIVLTVASIKLMLT